MGNCIERCKHSSQTDHDEVKSEQKNGKMRIKIVLTKEELEWLMLQLNDTQGNKKNIEDVLGEIQRSREDTATANWKPSLDSILE
ncbi:hypothetical protein ACS0TY_011709 [Phlomoides rotata]